MTDEKAGTPKDSHYARLRRAHRERSGKPTPTAPRRTAVPGRPAPADRVRLYGLHTVEAALGNPARNLRKLYATRNALARLGQDESSIPCAVEIVEPRFLDAELGSEAVHQGVMLETDPLPHRKLTDIGQEAALILVLDQVTDPHNVGAILRSAVAFGAGAVVTTSRHSPQESGVLAKSASGALEHVPYIQITNLADALNTLTESGYTAIGLDSDGEHELEATFSGPKIALVLGSEGKGLRQKTRETVSALARLEAPGAIRSLNVSNAAAVALYAARRFLA